jgi:argininosuccinate lyase
MLLQKVLLTQLIVLIILLAYKATGELVALCIDKNLTLETLPIEEYQKVCDLFDDEVYTAINLEKCVADRLVVGGPSIPSVENQINTARELIGE